MGGLSTDCAMCPCSNYSKCTIIFLVVFVCLYVCVVCLYVSLGTGCVGGLLWLLLWLLAASPPLSMILVSLCLGYVVACVVFLTTPLSK